MERCAERDPVLPERESGHWKEGEGELVGLRCLLERGVMFMVEERVCCDLKRTE